MATYRYCPTRWHLSTALQSRKTVSMGIVDEEQDAARADLVAAAAKIAEGQDDLRKAVARAREARLSVTEIAKLGGVSRPTIYYWSDSQSPE